MTPEYKVIQSCRNYLDKLGYMMINLVEVKPAGIPDMVTISPSGQIYWLEFKTKSGRLSKIQEYQISKLKEYKQSVYVIRSLDDLKEVIECEE